MTLLLLTLLALPLPSADPCADVFDRTERCAAVDAEALPTPVDPVAPLAAPEGPDLGMELSTRLLAGSLTAALLAGTAGVGALVYQAHIGDLEARAAPALEVEEARLQQSIVAIGAGTFLGVAGLLAGTSVAFFVFDPSEGRAREAFRIEE